MTAGRVGEAAGAGVFGFGECVGPARRLAQALGLPGREVRVHRFPDGERLVRVDHGYGDVILYRSLNDPVLKDPDDKLVEVLLAAAALRDQGARRLTLVAPYLAYMRQDVAFHSGEAVSQKVMAGLLGPAFDRLLTVDPHLHRVPSIGQVFPATEALSISAAPALARLLADDRMGADTLILGPDSESRALTAGVAEPLGCEYLVAEKERRGDRRVTVRLPRDAALKGRRVILVDDVVSTGTTLMECARLAVAGGAAAVEAVIVHALFAPATDQAFREAGIGRLRSTDSLAHPTNAVPLAPLLAAALA